MGKTHIENINEHVGPEFTISCQCGSQDIRISQEPIVLYGSLHADINTKIQCNSCGVNVTLFKGKR